MARGRSREPRNRLLWRALAAGIDLIGAWLAHPIPGRRLHSENVEFNANHIWTRDEFNKIGAAEELEIASLRRDGTLRNPVTIWVVRHGDDLYVRSYKGRTASWFRRIHVRHEGQIRAGGVERDVTFVDADPDLNDQIDAAYRTKYRRYAASIVRSIVSREARSASIKLVPCSTSS